MAIDTTPQPGLQKINSKFLLEGPREESSYEFLLLIFGRWRGEEGEEIIDLADYLHVPEGPGCLIVSHRWHFGIDFSGGRPGLFFSSRKNLRGSAEDRFRAVLRETLEKGKRLVSEPEFPPGTRPLLGDLEVVINDRVLYPNTHESDADLRPGLLRVLDSLYGEGSYTLEREPDRARRLSYRITAEPRDGRTFDDLISRLEGAALSGGS